MCADSLSTRVPGYVLAGLLVALLGFEQAAHAQFNRKWVSIGSLHNWYSEIGGEVESGGFVATQQDGLRWPGTHRYTDAQAWKGLWIGAANVTDELGTSYPFRVVHVGPRVTGAGEFFPVAFELQTRYELPSIFVDGLVSESLAPMIVDEVEPGLEADAVLRTVDNTLLGLTMERRVLQFGQSFHDNYHVIEYTFTNTGNTDGDADVELPNQTLEGVYVYLQWRWSVAKETRYIIGNPTGWGINTMLDTWGDTGGQDDIPGGGPPVRAQLAWHGYYPAKRVAYNNLGGPILPQALPDEGGQVAPTDTLGRLGAYQFVGTVTLHADAAAADTSDDPAQPSTTAWIESDAPFESNNDAFNPAKMETEYRLMSGGHKLPAHAYTVEPTGLAGWTDGTGDPSLGSSGGFSAANGYGPYTLAPGENFRIVIAEASAGISREAAVAIGRAYKASGANDDAMITYAIPGRGQFSMPKNEWVMTGRDSLYQTFRRALANYESGYAIPSPPPPPSAFEVNSGGDRISLAWDYTATGPAPQGFEIYRAQGRFDSTYTLIHTAGAAERSFDDTTPIRGIDYYYYVVAVGSAAQNTGAGQTPAGVALRSSRFVTQTFTPARLKRQPGETMADVRVVPNPFNLSSSPDLRWPDQTDKLGFLNIPGQCRIDIFTETGELVDTILHTDGSGDAFWNHTTSARQVVASGVYIAVVTNLETQERAFRHFVIIR